MTEQDRLAVWEKEVLGVPLTGEDKALKAQMIGRNQAARIPLPMPSGVRRRIGDALARLHR